jgi:small subunit ribosomal protein S20
MANTQSAKKRVRQSLKRRLHNMMLRSRLRTVLRNVLGAIQKGDRDAANASYKVAVPQIDKMVTKGITGKNRAARYKSRLNTKIRELSKT